MKIRHKEYPVRCLACFDLKDRLTYVGRVHAFICDNCIGEWLEKGSLTNERIKTIRKKIKENIEKSKEIHAL